jgi:uncharacterized protein
MEEKTMPVKNSKYETGNGDRIFSIRSIKMETREENGKRHIAGVIPYDSMSEEMYGFREIIRKGAFTKSLQEGDIRCLWNHDTQKVCGRSKADTLTLEDREDGLHFDDELPATSWSADLFESVSRRDAPGVSFGFQTVKDRWTYDETGNGTDQRELLEVRLFEVSVGVAFPAYPESGCTASTRSLAQEAGINLDIVGKVLSLRKYRTDYICSDADAAEIRNIIGSLQKLLPDGKPAAGTESRTIVPDKPDEKSTCEARERDLALLELEAETL